MKLAYFVSIASILVSSVLHPGQVLAEDESSIVQDAAEKEEESSIMQDVAEKAVEATGLNGFIFGYKFSEITLLIVEKATSFEATMTDSGFEEGRGSLFIAFDFVPTLDEHKVLGLSIRLEANAFELNKQEFDGKSVNVGTSAEGFYAFIYAVGFVNLQFRDSHYFRIGLGAGFGFAKVSGNVKFVSSPNDASAQKKDISADADPFKTPKLVSGFLVEYVVDYFFTDFQLGGPTWETEKFVFTLFDSSARIGVKIPF